MPQRSSKPERYTAKGLEKIRLANEKRFLRDAKTRFGDKFDYSRVEYVRQKIPVLIGCPEHGYFSQTPVKHLQSKYGCPRCGVRARGEARLQETEKTFLKTFEQKHALRLELLSRYQGAKELVKCRCKIHEREFQTTPDRLNQWTYLCPVCAREASAQARLLDESEFLLRLEDKFGSGFDFSQTRYRGMFEPVLFVCPRHGNVTRRAVELLNSNHGCSKCGKESVGYAGYRIDKLERKQVTPKETRIALMKVKVFGISTYKLGITTRSLEDRYKDELEEIYFEAVLSELDALKLEQLLHAKYADMRDERVFKAGMRRGKRWGGDSELYFKKAITPMLRDLKQFVRELEDAQPAYWDTQPQLMPPWLEVRQPKERTGVAHQPKPVICLDDGQVFPSAGSAARAFGITPGTLAMVCRGERRQTKGHRFAYFDDFQNGTIPEPPPDRSGPNSPQAKPVICLDTGEIFPTSIEAAKKTKCQPSHITSVCRGNRRIAGGHRWAYLKEFREGRSPQPPVRLGRRKRVIFLETGETFASCTDAAKSLGISGSMVSKHCKGRVSKPKFRFVK